jgi:hypothetical protein
VPPRPPSTRGAGLGAAIPAKPQGLPQAAPLTSWSVTLTASPNLLWPTQYSSLTATANADVGPTPYYIEIFNETGALLAVCGSGTSCSATFTPSYAGSNLVAFVTTYSAAFPPSGIVASSNVATTYLRIIP